MAVSTRRDNAAGIRAARRVPETRGFTELGVPPDPTNVGLQCLRKLVRALLELSGVIKEDEIQPRSASGTSLSCT
jgi:hypothetical protein